MGVVEDMFLVKCNKWKLYICLRASIDVDAVETLMVVLVLIRGSWARDIAPLRSSYRFTAIDREADENIATRLVLSIKSHRDRPPKHLPR